MTLQLRDLGKVLLSLVALMTWSTGLRAATVERQGNDAIFVDGAIDGRTASQISQLLDGHVRRLLIRSEGGRTDIGMDFGALLQKHALSVEVVDYCMSSCANYVFLGAAQKSVQSNGVVLWHGGLTNSRNFDVRDIRLPDKSERLRELVFYASRGVSLDIVVYSSLLTLGKPTGEFTVQTIAGLETKVPTTTREFNGWVPSKAELERLGVSGIGDYPAFSSDEAAERVLSSHGFEGMRLFTGRAYSKMPSGLSAW
jgi:hypothetical protein